MLDLLKNPAYVQESMVPAHDPSTSKAETKIDSSLSLTWAIYTDAVSKPKHNTLDNVDIYFYHSYSAL